MSCVGLDKVVEQVVPKHVVADATHHGHVVRQTGRCAGLVGALATAARFERAAHDGGAQRRDDRRVRRQVLIGRANNNHDTIIFVWRRYARTHAETESRYEDLLVKENIRRDACTTGKEEKSCQVSSSHA